MQSANVNSMTSLRKWTLVCGIAIPAAVIYVVINRWNSSPERAIYFSIRPLDVVPWVYQPWTSIPYSIGGILSVLAPFAGSRSRSDVTRAVCGFGLLLGISFLVYAFLPVTMERPDYSEQAVGSVVMRWIVAIDAPANCLPSLHTGFAVACAALVSRYRWPRFMVALFWVNAVVVMITTITTGQHYVVDLVAGVVAAFVALRITAGRLTPSRSRGDAAADLPV